MRLKEYLVLFALAALWGASFLFIKVAIADMTPLTLVAIRLTVATLGLLCVLPFSPGIMRGWHSRLRGYAIVALFNAIIPYLAISWGEEYIPSGMAAILNATTPLAIVIVSHWWPGGERINRARLGGVLIGFIGVALLVGPAAFVASATTFYLFGASLVLVGSVSYAFGGLFASKLLVGLPTLQPAIGQNAVSAVMIAPIAAVVLIIQPRHPIIMPLEWAIASALALALGGTSLAYLCYYWLIKRVGPTRTLIVTYLLPCFALVYGAVLLHEAVGINAIGGLALVLLGIFFAGKKAEQRAMNVETSIPEDT